jgi:hypothetical protein
MTSRWVGLSQVGAIAASGSVALRLPSPGIAVSWFVTGSGHGRSAICAITAAQLKSRTDAQAPRLVTPASRPGRPGRMILPSLAEITRLPAAELTHPARPGHTAHWLT